LPIKERKAKLAELLINPIGALRYSISFTKDIDELLGKAKDLGLRGLIGKRSGAWVKIKLHLEQEFLNRWIHRSRRARKHFGALLVAFYEGKKLKFVGRVGTGFSGKLLPSLHSDLSKIQVESCPFFNVPTPGRSRWGQGLTPADLKRCRWISRNWFARSSSRNGRGMIDCANPCFSV
jgi:bifunctional non-homologous end joining protein LigD